MTLGSATWQLPVRAKLTPKVAAEHKHTAVLKSDGTCASFGYNEFGQCEIAGPGEGVTYTQVSAGGSHTVVLKSDGTVAV